MSRNVALSPSKARFQAGPPMCKEECLERARRLTKAANEHRDKFNALCRKRGTKKEMEENQKKAQEHWHHYERFRDRANYFMDQAMRTD